MIKDIDICVYKDSKDSVNVCANLLSYQITGLSFFLLHILCYQPYGDPKSSQSLVEYLWQVLHLRENKEHEQEKVQKEQKE